MFHKNSEMISMKSVKDMDSSTNWRRLYSFAFIVSEVSKHAKDSVHSKNNSDEFQH